MNLRGLDRRSYKICRLRLKERKTFGEIAVIFNLAPGRVQQIYRAAVRRNELRQHGRALSPEYCLSVRALHALERVFGTIDVTRTKVLRALKDRRLHPGVTQNYGWKTHQEICLWTGISLDQLAAMELSRAIKDPDAWATGDQSPTQAQRLYLRALYEEAHEPIEENLTKAQASKRIDALKQKTTRGRSPSVD
jgi:hypothetical protein